MIIDGKKEAQLFRDEIKKEIESIKSKSNKVPSLSVILIGDYEPSQIYVKNKEKNLKIYKGIIAINDNIWMIDKIFKKVSADTWNQTYLYSILRCTKFYVWGT